MSSDVASNDAMSSELSELACLGLQYWVERPYDLPQTWLVARMLA